MLFQKAILRLKMLNLENFFSLNHFTHAALWQKQEPIWFPLFHLDNYLKTVSLGRIEIKLPDYVHLIRPESISIGKETVIEPGVCIEGPCIIGNRCIIRHGALLRGGVICGDQCVIGHAAEIKHSILLNGAHAAHFTYVGDSILGNGVNLGAGVKCSNLRLDRKEVSFVYEQKLVFTKMKKLGALLGDFVQVGCNSVLNPGTFVGKQSLIYPLVSVGGYIPSQSKISSERHVKCDSFSKELLERIGEPL